MTAPPRDHWCSLCLSRPTIGEPPRLICMPAAMGYPAVPAFGAAQKFAERLVTGWSRASSAPRDTSSFRRRLALSGFLLPRTDALCLQEVQVDQGECRGGVVGEVPVTASRPDAA